MNFDKETYSILAYIQVQSGQSLKRSTVKWPLKNQQNKYVA